MKRLSPLEWVDCYLGHGRMLESALIFVKFQYAIMLAVWPQNDIYVKPLEDIAPHDRWIIAVLFLIAAVMQSGGLLSNIYGYQCSRSLRIGGASVGMSMWIYMLLKNFYFGFVADGINPWMLTAIVGSMIIIRKAVLNYPRPGSQGLV